MAYNSPTSTEIVVKSCRSSIKEHVQLNAKNLTQVQLKVPSSAPF